MQSDCGLIGLDQNVILFDLLTDTMDYKRKEELVNLVEVLLTNDSPNAVISREPEEAIIVIFDTSSSMSAKYQSDDTNTRLTLEDLFLALRSENSRLQLPTCVCLKHIRVYDFN